MDNFMEKLTHKFSATDMIKANSQAEALELEAKKEQLELFANQMDKVDIALSDMRELNLINLESAQKNLASAQEVQELTKTSKEELTSAVDTIQKESVSMLRETSDISIAGINRAIDESLAKINEIKEANVNNEELTATINSVADKVGGIQGEMTEFMHADHVKIYRNVQAAMVEELAKQNADLTEKIKKASSIKPIAIAALIFSIINVVFTVLSILVSL